MRPSLTQPLVGAAVTVAAGILVGCASPPAPPTATSEAATSGPTRQSTPPGETPPTSQVLPTEPPLSVPGGGSSTPVDPAEPLFPDGPCSPGQLDVVAGPVEPALGYRQMRVRVTNHSRVPCVLAGYATVVARGTGGTTFRNPVGRLTGEGSEAQTVPLDPGGSAHADLGWRSDLAAAGVERVGILWLVVTAGSTPAVVQLDPTSPVDIVDGTEVRVGGWRPGAD
ncbi:DUF4232 domain-containing protein [Terrabacter sp. 2RAF25]|uniref:DUF4232 domain-containing protein n=1 Tax=Terrabacter sp. 2RAF25 TaxID=3232998 RepID=UPI003F9DF8F3